MKIKLDNIEIYYPNSEEYAVYLNSIFSQEAAKSKPLAIVCPKTHEEIVDFVNYANLNNLKFSVCGGGLSNLSIQNGIICLALNKYYNKVSLITNDDKYLIKVEGGAKIGTILKSLDEVGYHIPVGVSPLPGLGLIMRGGIGYLTRSEGLTLDYISEVKYIKADGKEVILNNLSEDVKLWNAIRGAAPRFGVVSEVTLKTMPGNSVAAGIFKSSITNLNKWLNAVVGLPNNISASLILGSESQVTNKPVLSGFVVNSNINGVDEINDFAKLIESRSTINWQQEPKLTNYMAIPDFNVQIVETANSLSNIKPFVKSYLVKNEQLIKVSNILIDAIKSPPNQFCRIDLQHMGGIMQSIDNGAVFFGRDADWNLVVTGFCEENLPFNEINPAVKWVNGIMSAIKDAVCGVYSVEIKSNRHETDDELQLAFNEKLASLRKLAFKIDKNKLLSHYPL